MASGSVEADIFLGRRRIVGRPFAIGAFCPIAHFAVFILDPLRERVKQNGGSVHGDGHPSLC